VRSSKSPLPSHPVFRLQQDFNFDLEVREALLKFAHELPDRTVSLDLLICIVSEIVRREELIERVPLAFDKERAISGLDLRRD
jgi:hypothetical protein